MRLPAVSALALVYLVASASAQEPSGEERACSRFRDVASVTEIELSDDRDAATILREDAAPIIVQLGTCGTGLVGQCAVDGAGSGIETVVLIRGWIEGEEDGDAPERFLLVNGVSAFLEACKTN